MRNATLAFSLMLAACASGPQGVSVGHTALDVNGAWKLDAIAGTPVLSGTNLTLTIADDGHINGNGGCNGFGGNFTREGDTLTFSQIVHTMMACTRPGLTSEQVMGQEHRFLSTLEGTLRASEPETNALVLTAGNGDTLRFERTP